MNGEAVHLILRRIHQNLLVSLVDGVASKNSKTVWNRINKNLSSHNVINRGRTWVESESPKSTGNIEEYIHECTNIIFEILGIGINLPPEIIAYSILGKIRRDCTNYNHIIYSMVISMHASINPQKVPENLSDLLQSEQNRKEFEKPIKTKDNTSSALLSNSNDFPFKILYVCKNGKNNPKNMTHTAKKCWALHPELRPPPRNKQRRGGGEAKYHKTGME
ncbi:hypothetical protein O181_026243 [Austropuccinia psidii MF-1]|uniref:Uncharacterized protein n=1 Tax=Austropuccinia psidii MF-1 TaxID=1389203 RepID=A0A9Q3CM68_9BASI|nr:hypothetical protein [Austropuccinia psidii MF-1]